ncbi:MAG: histidine phosphatase family protein [Promethearchaeota archaeon]
MELILARHGESKANILNVFSNTGYKHGLTKRGKDQTYNLAKRLGSSFKSIDLIYCSPLKRAVETTRILAGYFKISYKVSSFLVEFSVGELEGKSDTDSWRQYDQLWAEWFESNNWDASLTGGESLNQIIKRMKDFFDKVRIDKTKHGYQRILAIGHGGTILSIIPHLVENLTVDFLSEYRMNNSDFIVLDVTDTAIYSKSIHFERKI